MSGNGEGNVVVAQYWGLFVLVRTKRPNGGGQVMDVVFVDADKAMKPSHMEKDHFYRMAKDQPMKTMPVHFPVLAIPADAIDDQQVEAIVAAKILERSPAKAFIPSIATGASADHVGFDLRNRRIRYPEQAGRTAVAHDPDEAVTFESHECGQDINWSPLSMLADMDSLSGTTIDAKALTVPRPMDSSMSSIMSLSGGQLACIEPPLLFNTTIWRFPTPGADLKRRVAGSVEFTLETGANLVLEVDDLAGQHLGSITLDATQLSGDTPLLFKNVPALEDQDPVEDCHAMHFAALYSLFPDRHHDPVPHAIMHCEGPLPTNQTCRQWADALAELKKHAAAQTSDISPTCLGAFAVVDLSGGDDGSVS
jgi:hypothetical protein